MSKIKLTTGSTFLYVGFKCVVTGFTKNSIKFNQFGHGQLEQKITKLEFEKFVSNGFIKDIKIAPELTELEVEMLAIIKSMSKALLDVEDHLSFHDGNVRFIKSELSSMCTSTADYKVYLKNFKQLADKLL